MGLTTTQDLLEQAKERATARCERLLKVANGSCEIGALATVLHEIGAIWREDADAMLAKNQRGAKGVSTSLRDAATRVIAVAQDLQKYGGELGPTRSTVDTVPEGRSDVTTEFLNAVGHCGARELISGAVCTKPKHDTSASHHGNGITWPWENEIPIPRASDWTKDDAHAALVPEPSFAIEKLEAVLSFSIGAADAPPPWSMEPTLDVVPLNAKRTKSLPDHLSVSSLELLLSCPLKWRLHYLHGVPRRPSWALVGGSAVHACIKHLELNPNAQLNILGMTANQIRDLFLTALGHEIASTEAAHPEFPINTWQAPQGGKENREFWEHDGPEMTHRYLEWRKEWTAQGWEVLRGLNGQPVVEYEFLFKLPGTTMPLRGFIDSAWRNTRTGDIAVIDPKSGRSLPSDVFQLAVYAAALEHMGASLASGRWLGAYWSARDGALTPMVDLAARCPLDEVAYRVNNAVAQISAGAFAPNTNGNYGGCNSCDAKLSCPVGSRRNAGEVA